MPSLLGVVARGGGRLLDGEDARDDVDALEGELVAAASGVDETGADHGSSSPDACRLSSR